jgi:hypothetical protein
MYGICLRVTDANSVETKLSEIYTLKSRADMKAAVAVFGYFMESIAHLKS